MQLFRTSTLIDLRSCSLLPHAAHGPPQPGAAHPPASPAAGPARPPAQGRSRRACRSSAAPRWNPQNVDDPQVMPSPEYGPEETVRVQLEAVRQNDQPWPNHGIQAMYEFGYDIGGMERSRYFGYSKDLYHFDHFLGQFQNAFPELLRVSSYEVGAAEEAEGGRLRVPVQVSCGDGAAAAFVFTLERKDVGRKKGALMTRSIARQ